MTGSRAMLTVFTAALLWAVFAAPALAENIYVESETARLRAGPGTDYPILWKAPRYYPLEYLCKYQAWYVARDHEGDVGWVHEQVIGKGRAAIVINEKANIRKGPGTNNPIVFVVEKGYLFKVLDEKGAWYKVLDTEGDEGWVYGSLVWVSR
ncbi:MAG: SH3 domain-containing protein [Candidatus Nitrospinota bacterium M3_3B_026]